MLFNPRQPPQQPPVFNVTDAYVREEARRLIKEEKTLRDRLVDKFTGDSPNFHDFNRVLALHENVASLYSNIIGFYQYVSPDSALRRAAVEAEKDLSGYKLQSLMRNDISALTRDVYVRQRDDPTLESEDRKLLERDHHYSVGLGVHGSSDCHRKQYEAYQDRLLALGEQFTSNLHRAGQGIWLTTEEVKTIPSEVVNQITQEVDGSEDPAKHLLPLEDSTVYSVLRYCEDDGVRRKVLIANENSHESNAEILQQAVVIRDASARLLGYSSHAAFRLQNSMAGTPDNVNGFLSRLENQLQPGSIRELDQLNKIKWASTGAKQPCCLWDQIFYSRVLLEKGGDQDRLPVSSYFPTAFVVDSMLEMFGGVFGLHFVQMTDEDLNSISPTREGHDLIWCSDVQVYAVWNDERGGSGFVGYLYIDVLARDGKCTHSGNFNLQPGFTREDGTRHCPVTALVCSFDRPTAEKPSLLEHQEVTTLAHELGHAIHDLVSKTKYSRFHGTSSPSDFVEIHSHLLEHWCWIPSKIKSISKHWSYLSPTYERLWRATIFADSDQPAEQISDTLIGSILDERSANSHLRMLEQVRLAVFDMSIHTPGSHSEASAIDLSILYNMLRKGMINLDGPETSSEDFGWGHGEGKFGHLFWGYDAMYYSYVWSEICAADIFQSVFEADCVDPDVGMRYRKSVLEGGSSRDETQVLEEFLGRRLDPAAFIAQLKSRSDL